MLLFLFCTDENTKEKNAATENQRHSSIKVPYWTNAEVKSWSHSISTIKPFQGKLPQSSIVNHKMYKNQFFTLQFQHPQVDFLVVLHSFLSIIIWINSLKKHNQELKNYM